MYDFYDAVEKHYVINYSNGSETERSFWQNVGKIVNKKEIFEQKNSMFEKILKAGNDYISGRKWRTKQN